MFVGAFPDNISFPRTERQNIYFDIKTERLFICLFPSSFFFSKMYRDQPQTFLMQRNFSLYRQALLQAHR